MGLVEFSKFKVLPIEKLVKAVWNYKKDNPRLTEKLVANIKRNGQVENLLVRGLPDGTFEVVNGNHRLDALIQLEAAIAVCYDLGEIDEDTAKRIAIETNETRFETDQVDLSHLLKGLSETFGAEDLLETLPFTETELDRYLGLADFSFDDYEDKKPADDKDGDEGLKIKLTGDQYAYWREWLVRNEALEKKEQYGELLAEACRIALLSEEDDS